MNPEPIADSQPDWSPCSCGEHHAGDISHAQMISALRTNQYILRPVLHGLSDEQLSRPAPDGGWSMKQHLDHMAAATHSYYQCIKAMVEAERPTLGGVYRGDEVAANSRPIDELTQDYAVSEALLANLLTSLSDGQWQRGAVTKLPNGISFDADADSTAVHIVEHDREHIAALRQLRKALGVPEPSSGCVCGLHHAGDISHEQILVELNSHADEIATMVQGLSAAQLTRPAPDGGWGIQQLVGHLRDSAATYAARIELMLNQEHPAMPQMSRDDEANYNSTDFGTMLAAMRATNAHLASQLATLTPEQWQRTGVRKSASGDAILIVDDTAVHHIDHEREHMAQIKGLL